MIINCYYSSDSRRIVDLINEFCKFRLYLNERGNLFLSGFINSGVYDMVLDGNDVNPKQTALELLHFLNLVSSDGIDLINNNLTYDEINAELKNCIISLTKENDIVFRLDGNLFSFDKENKLTLIPTEESEVINQSLNK